MILILLAACALLTYSIVRYYRFIASYPKGPTPLPFIGNLHKLSPKKMYDYFEKVSESKEFGSIFTVCLPFPTVILSTYEDVKEAFVTKGDIFIGRPHTIVTDLFSFIPNGGVINSSGPEWREQRRTAIAILKDFGMGRNLMEQQVVQASIEEYLQCLDAIKDKRKVDMRWPLQKMISNVINETLFGVRYKYDDCDELIDYVEGVSKLLEDASNSALLGCALVFPWIRHIPIFGNYALANHRNNIEKLFSFIRRQVDRTLADFDPKEDEPTCFVHAYAQRMLTNDMLTFDQLCSTAHDFFIAGQETTVTTLSWATLYMAQNQDVQDRLRAEIHNIVGTERLVCMTDKPLMPYAVAVVNELQRVANVFGINLEHTAEEDTEIRGVKIPKGSHVNADLHYIHSHDPIFKEASEFRPERYLNEDGTLNKRTIPFSLGKRQCAGEGLARMELFLCLVATIQHYRILPLDNGTAISFEHKPMSILIPVSSVLRIEKITE